MLPDEFKTKNPDENQWNRVNNIGYIINKIAPESPAYVAGLEPGDIIINFDDYLIDNYGMTKLKNGEIVHLDYLIYNKSSIDNAIIKVIKKSTKNIISVNVDFKNNDFYKIKYLYSPFDNINYIVIGGIVMMDLTNNHLNIFKCNQNLIQFNDITKKNENKVIITSIIPGSNAQSLNIFKPGSLIKTINGIKINNLIDIDKSINENKIFDKDGKKYIEITDEQNKVFIINIENAIIEDIELAKNNNYKSVIEKYK
jgi:S1-C subfamily serine protease